MGKSFAVNHFVDEGRNRRVIYRIIKNFQNRNTTKRKVGTGRKPVVMTKSKLRRLKIDFNHNDKITVKSASRKYKCDRKTIKYWLRKLHIKRYRKKKAPKYTQVQETMVKRQCRRLYRRFRTFDFIIDDEKYFTLSGPSNGSFFSSSPLKTPNEVKFKCKEKYEPKVMLWIAISQKGISKPYFRNGGLAINQKIYQKECLTKRLLPFIETYHSQDNYIFWPDKASSHYANDTIKLLKSQNVYYVDKYDNPTNVPQCRPIEDFFGYLSGKVYNNGWRAEDLFQLKNRIIYCLKKIDLKVV